MVRLVTLRLFDNAYQAFKRYAGLNRLPIDSWIENQLDVEDLRRRCAEHDRWMRTHPEIAAFSEAWADRNLDELAKH
ncbi:hypothetical protein [Mycobacterium talmoniae]|uniref:Uncharacterized protein n=1 Tax=Mycobacterium talmoniae TaxID=1858794 RepID=A0A1S1NCL9_9MYCO|nr:MULTISPECIES: hypothetical protein [Mycobacterium]OHU96073.1 hypothetical protein BKN37_22875 [Mycobacterium talmoniae]PQM46356.1 hypothetical protein C1Y40_03476 [Mycobacterium talmoniae]TDH56178.1 hypothetical protein E2F47_07910 [Mycobacterium eburneum]